MAEGMADFYNAVGILRLDTLAVTSVVYSNQGTFTAMYNHFCGPGSSEQNVTDFVYLMSLRDPRGFMSTYKNPRLVLGLSPPIGTPVRTFAEYWAVWNGLTPPNCIEVASPEPGTWNASKIYSRAILRSSAGNPSAVETGSAREFNGIRWVSPNPCTNGILRVGVSSRAGNRVEVSLFDVRGRLVAYRKVVSRGGDEDVDIGIGKAGAGVYLIHVKAIGTRPWRQARKIVVLR
jgi:hypothetical protein